MHTIRVNVIEFYHHIKNSKRLSLLVLTLLFAAIPTTVFLAQKAADIRQHADSYAATITVNPTTATPGDTLTVSWTFASRNSSSSVLIPKAYAQAYAIGGHISASPNPCKLSDTGTCTSTISWNYTIQGGDKASPQVIQVRIKEANGAVFAQNASGSQAAPWINATPTTFELYADDTLLDSVTVEGINSGNTPSSTTVTTVPIQTGTAGSTNSFNITGAESLQLVNTTTNVGVGPRMYLNCATAGENGGVSIPASPIFSGNCPFTIPTTTSPGTYTIRMFAADRTTVLGNSPVITISAGFSLIPIYRLINATGTTFFWADAAQKDAMLTQKLDGKFVWDQNPVIAWYATSANQPGATPIYRLVKSDGSTFFWADAAQKDAMLTQKFDGKFVWDQNPVIAFYATSANQPGAFPIYRLINTSGTAFFWANAAQKDAMLTQKFDGKFVWDQNPVIAFYAYTAPTVPTAIPTPTPSNRPIPNVSREDYSNTSGSDDPRRYNGYGVEATSTPVPNSAP